MVRVVRVSSLPSLPPAVHPSRPRVLRLHSCGTARTLPSVELLHGATARGASGQERLSAALVCHPVPHPVHYARTHIFRNISSDPASIKEVGGWEE